MTKDRWPRPHLVWSPLVGRILELLSSTAFSMEEDMIETINDDIDYNNNSRRAHHCLFNFQFSNSEELQVDWNLVAMVGEKKL